MNNELAASEHLDPGQIERLAALPKLEDHGARGQDNPDARDNHQHSDNIGSAELLDPLWLRFIHEVAQKD